MADKPIRADKATAVAELTEELPYLGALRCSPSTVV